MRNHKVVATRMINNHPQGKAEWLFFYCLCSKYKMMNTKAKFMIVIPINPKNSSLIVITKTVSTIAPPPLSISQLIAVE